MKTITVTAIDSISEFDRRETSKAHYIEQLMPVCFSDVQDIEEAIPLKLQYVYTFRWAYFGGVIIVKNQRHMLEITNKDLARRLREVETALKTLYVVFSGVGNVAAQVN